jgi:hypothetical protein
MQTSSIAAIARASRLCFAVLCIVSCVLPASAGAVTGGEPDGSAHPYVAFLDDGPADPFGEFGHCSGTLVSPTVLITAAHCFSGQESAYGGNGVTGASLVRVSFDPDLVNTPADERVWFFGTYYPDPEWHLGVGLSQFDNHDVAVVVFTSSGCVVPADQRGTCGPIPSDVTRGRYAALPDEGLVQTLPMGAPVDLVGFGVQGFDNGGGPCGGPCRPQPTSTASRFFATTRLISVDSAISDRFVKLQLSKGGFCIGDSGGPDLLGGTDIILAENTFLLNLGCQGMGYSFRVDTPEALGFIRTTVAAHGGRL